MTDALVRRIYRAREAAMAAGIDTEQLRLNRLAHAHLVADREQTKNWDLAMSGRKFMGMEVVIEYAPLPPLSAYSDLEGASEMIERPTICVAGRNGLGRWQYFEASEPVSIEDQRE